MIFIPSTLRELVIGGDGILRSTFRILDDELKWTAVNTARGVDLVGSHLLGLARHRAIRFAEGLSATPSPQS